MCTSSVVYALVVWGAGPGFAGLASYVSGTSPALAMVTMNTPMHNLGLNFWAIGMAALELECLRLQGTTVTPAVQRAMVNMLRISLLSRR